MVILAMIGSFVGYVAAYVLGYWAAFREDYRGSSRSMAGDIIKLQIVEQLPNLGTVVAAGLTQGVLIGSTDVPPVVAVNIGSWFGPQKILNLAAMLASNSLKKAWVDHAWKPRAIIGALMGVVLRAGGKGRALLFGWRLPAPVESAADAAGVQAHYSSDYEQQGDDLEGSYRLLEINDSDRPY